MSKIQRRMTGLSENTVLYFSKYNGNRENWFKQKSSVARIIAMDRIV